MTNTHVRTGTRGAAGQAKRPLWLSFAPVWRRHRDLLNNASTLVATTGVTAALGFIYWAVAARMFSQRAVGYGSAAVSAMTLLGTIGMLGMGTVLICELPRRRPRAGLVSAALIASGLGSLVLGLTFAVVAPHLSGRFGNISGTVEQATLFVVGVALTGVSLVFDQATIGLLRGGLQLSRNAVFAAAKLLVLPAAAVILHDDFGMGILAAWVAGTAVSLVPVAIRLRLAHTHVLPRPDWAVLRGLGRTALAHNWLNLAVTVPQTLIPVLVIVVVSPSANAAFYAAWTLAGFLRVVPIHLSTVLFAVAAADPHVIARKLRFTLRLSLLIGLPGMIVLGLGAHLALSLFGPSYASAATVPLLLLVISYIPGIPKLHYMAVCRATGQIPRAAAVLTVAAAAEVTAAVIGGASGVLNGLSFALLAVYIGEGLVTTPPVLRAAIGHGRHRYSDPLAVTGNNLKDAARRPEKPDWQNGGRTLERVPMHEPYPKTPAHGTGSETDDSTAPSHPRGGSIVHPALSESSHQEAGIAALLSLARSQAGLSRPEVPEKEHP